jgi:glucosyl-dolichyl phosphate glucuronosyltransferase
VGCSYRGMPGAGPIRNPIGASMSMQTRLALEAGGFDATVGRVGSRPTGCEETELSIRMTASYPGSVIYYEPTSVVDHSVASERVRLAYFARRCWHEGLSKASVVRLSGAQAGLERERRQAAVVIPRAFARQAGELARGRVSALSRMAALATGLAVTAAGYLTGRVRYR